ncbi:MAG: aminotransferase class IV [Haloarculaceae archaeon]
MQYHVNGELVPAGEATVSVEDRGFRYGDAARETLRVYGGEVFEWDAHRERLRRTCEALGMAEAVPDDLRERVRATLAANDLSEAAVRLSVTRGQRLGGLTPSGPVDPTVVVVVEELPPGGSGGEPVWEEPAGLQTVTTRRAPDDVVPATGETHSALDRVLARRELVAGNDEALVRDAEGNVVGGAASNVFFVDEAGLNTPGTDGPVFPGVTREVVLELAEEEAIPVETGRYVPGDVRDAEEAFLTSTTWEVRPVASVDGVPVGSGPVTDLLAARYRERVEEACYRKA